MFRRYILWAVLFQLTTLPSFAQERPVRFVIGSFVVDGANDDLIRKFRSEVQNQLFDLTDQCIDHLEFIPDAQEDAIENLSNISARYKREYGIDQESIPIPKQGNYIIFVRVEPDNNGTYLQIGVFERDGSSLTYAGNGVAESELAINTLYTAGDRKEFIQRAIQNAFPPQRVDRWISRQSGGKSGLDNCSGNVEYPDPLGKKGEGVNTGLGVSLMDDPNCGDEENGFGTLCIHNQTKNEILVSVNRTGWNFKDADHFTIHPNQKEYSYGLTIRKHEVLIKKAFCKDPELEESRTIIAERCKVKTLVIR